MQVAHIAFWTRDLDISVAFWCQYFGARCGDLYESKNQPGFRSRFLTLDSGPTLELMSAPWPQDLDDPAIERIGWSHIAISVGSKTAVDALAERLKADGRLLSGPRQTGDGYYEALAQDPFGNRIEITI